MRVFMFLGVLSAGMCGIIGLPKYTPASSAATPTAVIFLTQNSMATPGSIPEFSPSPIRVLVPTALHTRVPLKTRIAPPPSLTPSPVITASSTQKAEDTALSKNKMVIGYSITGRPLEVYQFGDGEHKRMIIAGIHGGNEYNTIALAEELIRYTDQHAETVPSDMTLYILRSLNPDGEARGRDNVSRANENGVDLNRNFPALWQPEWERGGCWNYLHLNGGIEAGSEPETRILMDFVISHKVKALINYHSAALGIFPGGQPPDPDSINLAEAISSVSNYPYPPIDTGCIFSGQLIDWASMNGIAALDIELTNHHDTDFEQNLGILNVFLGWQP